MKTKVSKTKIEYWMNKTDGTLYECERNPCGCHPEDYIIANELHPLSAMTYSFNRRAQFIQYMKSWNRTKLG